MVFVASVVGWFEGSVVLTPGDVRTGWIVFEVPIDLEVLKMTGALNSGFGPEIGEWNLVVGGQPADGHPDPPLPFAWLAAGLKQKEQRTRLSRTNTPSRRPRSQRTSGNMGGHVELSASRFGWPVSHKSPALRDCQCA